MTELVKLSTRLTIPGTPGVPGSAGSPGVPGHWATEYQNICKVIGGQRVALDGKTSDAGQIVYIGGSWVCSLQPFPVWIPGSNGTPPSPGIPGTADSTIVDNNLGWNSGGVSIRGFASDGGFSFQVDPSVVGVIVGLTQGYLGQSVDEVTHGFLMQGGVYYLIEDGVASAAKGTYSGASVFKIVRTSGVVTYLKDDVLVGTSDVTTAGAEYLAVFLYSAGDRLFNPTILDLTGTGTGNGNEDLDHLLPYGAGAMPMRPMSVTGGTGTYAFGSMAMRPMAVFNVQDAAGNLAFQPMSLLGGEGDYSVGSVSMQPMTVKGGTVTSGGDLTPHFAIGFASFAPMGTLGSILTGEVMDGNMSFKRFFVLGADRPYAQADLEMEAPIMWGDISPPSLDVTMLEHSFMGSLTGPYSAFEYTLQAHLKGQDSWGVLFVFDRAMREHLSAEFDLATAATLNQAVNEVMASHASLPLTNDDGETWVVNSDSAASTTYEGFDFNSFCEFQGNYYAARADGVYLLGGDLDDGSPIAAMLGFGTKTFGTTAKKTVPDCYLGLSSTGAIFLKVLADGQQYTYRADRSSPDMATQRIKLGKGLKASHLSFELYNQNGADFELDSVEFNPVVMTRRT